ncbi:MAG: leucine-rich repeat domain-containing protein [Clostridia bacterium]|nr:leucine-rich repeat domain-containing protein [Clostridia bacterium]
MVDNNIEISKTELLYDPLFDKKPDLVMKDKKSRRFKIVFITVIAAFVGLSLYFSFNSISSDKYTYRENDTGYTLYQFVGKEDDIALHVDYVRNESGEADTAKPITQVREFSMSCNEYVRFIFIGKNVSEIQPHCFYYTKNLMAVIVDPENQSYTSVDGVLYSKDMKEIILHPIRNHQYRTALRDGTAAPTDETTAKAFLEEFTQKYGDETVADAEEYAKQFSDEAFYRIPDSVAEIEDSCFSDCEALTFVDIPSSVKRIGNLAFFKCKGFETITIPDGVESIGSDGFSYCELVTYIYVPESVKFIGHHAFYGDLGCDKIYLGAENEDSIETGENWLPKQSTTSLKSIEAVYGQERRAN